MLDCIALLAQIGDVFTFGIRSGLDLQTNFLADTVAFRLKAAALLLEIALLLSDQLQFGQIKGLAPTPSCEAMISGLSRTRR